MLLTSKARKQKGVLTPVHWHKKSIGKYIEIEPDSNFSIYDTMFPGPGSLIKYIRIAAEEGFDQVLWCYEDKITEVGTMNVFFILNIYILQQI